MTAPALLDAYTAPCPDWCVEDRMPDPGVVDHFSRVWSGSDWLEVACWKVQVTQTVTHHADGSITEGLAGIIVSGADSTFGSVAEFTRALMQAEGLKNRINAGRRQVL
ncbi:hypothetical protein [Micromonospora sp. NBC_00421]|uniref:hypothetical protein n=1 Tax=Micromonospora sp. NBC_00421 TaxID=2975976 RepID=UPI002E1E1564